MAEKKQPRDKNGHFAEKNGESVKTSSKKVAVDWQAAYDNKVLELQKKDEKINELNKALDEHRRCIESTLRRNENLDKAFKREEGRAKLFFDTIEKQNNHLSELREQMEWFKDKLPWYKKLRYFKLIQQMHEQATYLRMRVIESMDKWSDD